MPIDLIVEKMKRKFGEFSIMKGDDDHFGYVEDGISTGSLSVDMAIGRPGIPIGRLSEIAGEDASGKTALAIEIVYEAVRRDIPVFIVDTESAWDEDRLVDRGVDMSKIVFIEDAHTLEDVLTRVDALVETVAYDEEVLIVVDSIAGVSTKMEEEADYDEHLIGVHARVLAKGFRKLMKKISIRNPKEGNKKKIGLLCVNQLKTNVKMNPFQKGGALVHFAGYAMRYHASLRMVLDKLKSKEKETEKGPTYLPVRVFMLKNKIGRPFKYASFHLNFEKGIDKYRDLFEAGIKLGIVRKKGSFYSWKDHDKRFYAKKWKKFLKEEIGGYNKALRILRREAIKQGFIKPFGTSNGGSSTDEKKRKRIKKRRKK